LDCCNYKKGWKKKITEPKKASKSSSKRKLKFFDDEANCLDDSDADRQQDDEENDSEKEDDSFIDDDSSESDISDKDENEAAPAVAATSGPPSKKSKSRAVKPDCKIPGDISLPLNCFSLTISKVKDDVPYSLLKTIFENFIEKFTVKGGISTEVGARVGNCHLQSVFQSHCCASGPTFKLMRSMIRDLLPGKGRGYKLQVKPLAKGQSLIAMVGYITKDQGKAHYKILAHNITAQVRRPNLTYPILTLTS